MGKSPMVVTTVDAKRLQAAADELYDGELAPLLTHLVKSDKLTVADRDALRKMLDEMDGKGGKRK